MKHFPLTPGKQDRRLRHLAKLDEFFGMFFQSAKQVFAGRHPYAEVPGRLSSHHTVCGQQAGDLIDWQPPICVRFHFKAACTGFLVEENESLRMNREFLSRTIDYSEILLANHRAP